MSLPTGLPPPNHPIAGSQPAERRWYDWARRIDKALSATGEAPGFASAILALARKLGSPDGSIEAIPTSQQKIVGTEGVHVLQNEADRFVQVSLEDLPDTGIAPYLAKVSRDAKGRIEGTEAATTSDLPEGTNLYFTDARADARVAAGIAAHVAEEHPHAQYARRSDFTDSATVAWTVDPVTGAVTATAAAYTHPTTHAPSIIAQDANNRFVSDAEKSAWNGKQAALGYVPANTVNPTFTGGLTLTSGAFTSAGAGSGYFWQDRTSAAVGGWYATQDIVRLYREGSGDLLTVNSAGTVVVPGDILGRDLHAHRGDGTGVVYLNDGSRYLYFDGTRYWLEGAPLWVQGQPVSLANHVHTRLSIPDTRATAPAPNGYAGQQVQWDFKSSADSGAGNQVWHAILTVVPWTGYDQTHPQQQLVFHGNGLAYRKADSASSWSGWTKIIQSPQTQQIHVTASDPAAAGYAVYENDLWIW